MGPWSRMKTERERKCVIRGLNTRRGGQNERTEERVLK